MKTFIALISAAALATVAATSHHSLVVHEWGTFTTVAGEDGAALEWRPFAATNDLPDFVYDVANTYASGLRYNTKADLSGLVRMETPVLYFYATRKMQVAVKVDFPQGKITEWYPRARFVGEGIDWGRIAVLPGATNAFPVTDATSHYYAARDTDAAPLRVCSDKGVEYEKFLFYRGVGSFRLPVTAALDGEEIRLANAGEYGVPAFIVFENVAGQTRFEIHGPMRVEMTVTRPEQAGSVEVLGDELVKILCARGLYEKEARAMVATWRDSWFEEGLRVFYIVPRAVTDEILPLTIDPKPDELERVLVGRVELFTPEMQAKILANPERYRRFAEAVKQLGNKRSKPVSHGT